MAGATTEDIERELERQLQEEEEEQQQQQQRQRLAKQQQQQQQQQLAPMSHDAAVAPPSQRGAPPSAVAHEELRRKENFKELMYSFNSFLAVFWPVSATVILAALSIVYINDGLNGKAEGGQLTTLPQVADESAAGSSGEIASAAILNALVIVGIITGATFLMVGLYYFNMIRILVGWLVISTGMLLCFTTSLVVSTAFTVYQVPFDQITFWLFFYNFAICGILAIFYMKGIPMVVTQSYLVCVSVVMAWLLVRFLPEWTSWALLVLLAMYDLCAVLTPCGPLKCLIEISADKDVSMPGLLYEAQINDGSSSGTSSSGGGSGGNRGAAVAGPLGMFIFMADSRRSSRTSDSEIELASHSSAEKDEADEGHDTEQREREASVDIEEGTTSATSALEAAHRNRAPMPAEAQASRPASAQAGTNPQVRHQQSQGPMELFDHGFDERNSIKLGLGDFVFYSVLIGRAALNGFGTFVAVYVTVVAGLAGTLFLLAVYHKALPALPISIFFGVTFFFITDMLVTPMTNNLVLSYQAL